MDMLSIKMIFNRVVRKMVPNLRNIERYTYEPTSRKSLKVLNDKEQKLKDDIMKLIIYSKASDKEVVRVLAFLINSFKRL